MKHTESEYNIKGGLLVLKLESAALNVVSS